MGPEVVESEGRTEWRSDHKKKNVGNKSVGDFENQAPRKRMVLPLGHPGLRRCALFLATS
jgi:hypothetical protein